MYTVYVSTIADEWLVLTSSPCSSYPQEDGTLAEVKFVANENGFQPESSLLPVAPAFPHKIPQFVLDQIEFARLEDEAKARKGTRTRIAQL